MLPVRRTFRTLLVCGLTGVVVTVALAWAATLLAGPTRSSVLHANTGHAAPMWAVSRYQSFGCETVFAAAVFRESMVAPPPQGSLFATGDSAADRAFAALRAKADPSDVASWSHIANPPTADHLLFTVESRAGWPFPALHSVTRVERVVNRIVQGGWPISAHPAPQWNGFLRLTLPIHPAWPGFVANVLLWASVTWLLGFAPLRLRRILRGRAGLCPDCGYVLVGHSTCPECGQLFGKA